MNRFAISPRSAARLVVGALTVGLLATACGPRSHGDGPAGWSDAVSEAERASLRVVVFCDAPDDGERVLGLIQEAGYTNPQNYVHSSPNDDFNIKWGEGGASGEAVAELSAIVEHATGQRLTRNPIFEPGDRDVFINLPLARSRGPLPLETRPAVKGDEN